MYSIYKGFKYIQPMQIVIYKSTFIYYIDYMYFAGTIIVNIMSLLAFIVLPKKLFFKKMP